LLLSLYFALVGGRQFLLLQIFVNSRYIMNHRKFRCNCFFFTPPRVIHQNTKLAAVRLARKASAEIIGIQHGVHKTELAG
jgi:hypothetical protein